MKLSIESGNVLSMLVSYRDVAAVSSTMKNARSVNRNVGVTSTVVLLKGKSGTVGDRGLAWRAVNQMRHISKIRK
jgi:hypothetical protein